MLVTVAPPAVGTTTNVVVLAVRPVVVPEAVGVGASSVPLEPSEPRTQTESET